MTAEEAQTTEELEAWLLNQPHNQTFSQTEALEFSIMERKW